VLSYNKIDKVFLEEMELGMLFKDEAFGKNDLRGIIGEVITPELFEYVGRAYSEYIVGKSGIDKKDLWVSVAQDARTHSPGLTDALIKGLLSSGINILDLGICPTPLGYFSEYLDLSEEGIPPLIGTLVVTASHNPPQYNGLKLTYKKQTLSEEEIIELREITRNLEPADTVVKGFYRKYNIVGDYIDRITSSFSEIGKGIKVVVDSGNGTAGVVAPELYRKLGCEVIDIYSEPDGTFPNHHPDPSNEKNLVLLKEKISETSADFGIAFDGDSDRIGVIDNTGYSIPGDQLLLIFALDILSDIDPEAEKPVFISEVKCSQVLFDQIDRNNGRAIMWKTGHAYIKSKMKEEKAVLAGEMSGHIFFKDRYFGYDDAVYAGARFIEIAAKNKTKRADFKVSTLIEELPKAYTSRELRLPCPNELKYKVIDKMKADLAQNKDLLGQKIEKIITIDGLRIIFDKGFALIRASNTEPTFTLRFEGERQEDSENYKSALLSLLEDCLEKLKAEMVTNT
jgi:phosphomannomutase / phosphoglucomutase